MATLFLLLLIVVVVLLGIALYEAIRLRAARTLVPLLVIAAILLGLALADLIGSEERTMFSDYARASAPWFAGGLALVAAGIWLRPRGLWLAVAGAAVMIGAGIWPWQVLGNL